MISKDGSLEQLKEENEQLMERNKKWVARLDQEIEKNSEIVQNFTKQIKEFQEKNYKLEFEIKQRNIDLEKRAFKEQVDEVRRMDQNLNERSDRIMELEMQNFQLKE